MQHIFSNCIHLPLARSPPLSLSLSPYYIYLRFRIFKFFRNPISLYIRAKMLSPIPLLGICVIKCVRISRNAMCIPFAQSEIRRYTRHISVALQ